MPLAIWRLRKAFEQIVGEGQAQSNGVKQEVVEQTTAQSAARPTGVIFPTSATRVRPGA